MEFYYQKNKFFYIIYFIKSERGTFILELQNLTPKLQNFYQHPFIQTLKHKKKWTISDHKKMPIDIYMLKSFHTVKGALFTDEKSLVSLEELLTILPNVSNYAYFLDAYTDQFVVLDIEPTCNDDLKNELLQMPFIYGERSLSGKGYHLIFPLPECIYDYPIAQKKIVFKGPNKQYEILINHWVTFTGDQIESPTQPTDFIPFFEQMAKDQKEQEVLKNFKIKDIKPEEIPDYEYIVDLLKKQKFTKTLDDYDKDYSIYEFAAIGFILTKLNMVLSLSKIKNNQHSYSDLECTWITYVVARDLIEYRTKHDEYREGLPWLLYLVKNVQCTFDPNKKGNKK